MLNLLVAGTLAASLVAAPVTTVEEPAAQPPSQRVTVELVIANGSGCPAGTTAVAPSPDNTAFTVSYSSYLAQVGVGALPTDFRKNCQLTVQVNVPQGFTYAISKVDYRGFADLQDGARAIQRANYYFQGSSANEFQTHEFEGPYSDYWQTTDINETAELVWSPCGVQRLLNINTELRVMAGSSDPSKTTSFVAMDSTDNSVDTVYHLSWKRCR
jgi:hypothetical protein